MGLIVLYVYMVVQVEKPRTATIMSGMDGRAFGSPVAAATVATRVIAQKTCTIFRHTLSANVFSKGKFKSIGRL
jgi:hypothetical protein